MIDIRPGIWQWSCYSKDKDLDFNGLLIERDAERVLIDPPPMTPDDENVVRKGGPITAVIITNLHHARRSEQWRESEGARILVPEADRGGFKSPVDGSFSSGERLPGGLLAIGLEGMKSSGETALYWEGDRGGPASTGVMILGDALIGKPPGELSLLPSEMVPDATRARRSLRRLLEYRWDTLLVGDGRSFLTGGRAALEKFLASGD